MSGLVGYCWRSAGRRLVPGVRSAVLARFYTQEEYSKPMMRTSIPGPASKAMAEELSSYRDTGEVMMFVNYNKSRGNYVCDADGNIMLDLFQQIASLPLGYNHPALCKAINNEEIAVSLINRPSLSRFPPVDFSSSLKKSLMDVSPPGMNRVCTMMCGSCSNENAIKSAFIRYMIKKRDKPVDLNSLEYQEMLYNKGPGCPKICIMSFMGGYHGRTFINSTCSRSKLYYKLDVPAMDWPVAPFPHLKYPLDQYVEENKAEEERCLVEMEKEFVLALERDCPVAGVIVEPIQSEGGDRHASPAFFRGVQALCQKFDSALIVDEVQTGGGSTGQYWGHEAWNLPQPPTFVTFSKKMLTGGYFYSEDGEIESGRIGNTWMGDPARLVMLEAVIKEVKEKDLLSLVRTTGAVLLEGLVELTNKYPDVISRARGQGTYCAVDCFDSQTRDRLLQNCKNAGFHIGGCGAVTLRLRPALILEPTHAAMFLDGFNKILSDV